MELQSLIYKTISKYEPEELALGFLQYEALRKLNPREFSELYERNLRGEKFDDMVKEMVVKTNTSPSKVDGLFKTIYDKGLYDQTS